MNIRAWDKAGHGNKPPVIINDPVPTAIGLEFNRNGRTWRVSVVVDTFIIATAIDAVLDNHSEPSRSSDIIKVML